VEAGHIYPAFVFLTASILEELCTLDSYSKVVRVWFRVRLPNWAESLFYGNQVLHEIQLFFESMDIPFAFPTQTLQLQTAGPLVKEQRENQVPAAMPELDDDSPSRERPEK
jgi:hypothetical protein